MRQLNSSNNHRNFRAYDNNSPAPDQYTQSPRQYLYQQQGYVPAAAAASLPPLPLSPLPRREVGRSLDNQSVSSQRTISRKGLSDFEFSDQHGSGHLGQGSYGTVRLAIERSTGQRVAIKVVRALPRTIHPPDVLSPPAAACLQMQKSAIFKFCSVENLKREIKIQKRMQHRHICKLFHYFEDKQNVYLVLEFAQKGNLFNALRKAQKMDESQAFRYFFQTCLAIDHLHKNNIIHRDIKPENLLVDGENNIKVCDFGWSAESSGNSVRRTFCGTVDYMAPEMVKQESHDHRVDIWSLGVLLYELTHGFPPFSGTSQQEKLSGIQKNKPIFYRSSLEFDIIDLMKGALQHNQDYRISMEMILNHPWMKRHYVMYGIALQQFLSENKSRNGRSQTSISPTRRVRSLVSLNTSINDKESRNNSFNDSHANSSLSFDDSRTERKNAAARIIYAAQQKSNGVLNRLEEEDEDLFASSVNYHNIKRINEKQRAEEQKDESFFDKILIALGCITRDKNK